MVVKVTNAIYLGIEHVRKSGRFNMLDRYSVARMCFEDGYYEAAVWISENRSDYARLIFEGPEIMKETE